VYEADDGNFKVNKFSPNGRLTGSFGTLSVAGVNISGCQCLFAGVAVGKNGYLYVADDTHVGIDVFALSTKQRVLTWGRIGSAPGQFSAPTGVAIGSDGSIYVVDTGNRGWRSSQPWAELTMFGTR
jgi:DNA-binding beta-propeller fold protein YncE